MSNICGSAATHNDHEPTGNARDLRDGDIVNDRADDVRAWLWNSTPKSQRHVMADGRRAVLVWRDGVGTTLQVIDPEARS